jgi:ribosome-associated translation inhibitor RaiA
MKLSIVFKEVEKHAAADAEVQRCARKLVALLKSYDPDLVQLHCVFSLVPRSKNIAIALNLALPTGTLHCTADSKHLRVACKEGFAELNSQLKKHIALLRKDYEWKRKRPRPARPEEVLA